MNEPGARKNALHTAMKSRCAALLSLLAAGGTSFAADLPPGTKDESDMLHEVHVYHIVLHDEAAASALRQRLLDAAPKGVTLNQFKRAAVAESRDPGSASTGGDLGVVRDGVMVKEFEKAIFSADLNQVPPPVRTGFGWHLIYVTTRTQIPAAQLCASTLAVAQRQAATDQEREVLMFSGRARHAKVIHPKVLDWLGSRWDEPRVNARGDLLYWRTEPIPKRLGSVRLTMHIEYGSALYQGNPEGCRRSAVQEWEVRCAERTVALTASADFEGRAGVGRRLHEWRAQPDNLRMLPAADGLAGQMHARACKPAEQREAPKPGRTAV